MFMAHVNWEKTKSTHPKVNVVATSRPLELLHVDLMGPTKTESMGGKSYIVVVVNDFSRYSWVEFLREKLKACEKMEKLCKKLQNEKGVPIAKSEVTMGRSLRMLDLKHFAKSMVSRRNSQPQRLHNKMGLLKGRIG